LKKHQEAEENNEGPELGLKGWESVKFGLLVPLRVQDE